MSQLSQNNEAFDYNPEHNKLNQTNGSWQPYAGVLGNQLLPGKKVSPGFSKRRDGENAASLSLFFGALSLLCIPLWSWVWGADLTFISLILGILGIWQGRVARRHGVPAPAGRILSWAGVGIVLALYIFVILFLISLSHSL
ncbi:hypothetical protein [Rothia mucilaginosa]|uniref:hypothetical protein n=1 Tax=Rothia mucilaginosa TaxID=43675 RepID=UPI0007648E87|nr:hypothetical protein [Rothia mucilaginosa]